jgi:DNA-binding NarL/FixJ family response regulator
MPITVSIVEDHAKTRAAMVRLVQSDQAFRCVSAHATGAEALAEIPRLKAQVALVDIGLTGISGIEVTRRLKELAPRTRVVMLTVYEDAESLFSSLAAGADGYILKRTPPAQILELIKEVLTGGAPMSRTIARKVLRYFHGLPTSASSIEQLSGREREVLQEVATGRTNKEIADRLAISYDTVRTHLRRVYEKLHVSNRTEAVVKFSRRREPESGPRAGADQSNQ